MKIPAALNGPLGLALVAAVVIGAVYLIGRKAIAATVDAVSNVNAGTPYEGAGLAGTAGHAADAVTGGALSSLGSWISGAFFDPNSGYDPNAADPKLQTHKQAVSDQFYNGGFLQ
jgi:hypothetical protein